MTMEFKQNGQTVGYGNYVRDKNGRMAIEAHGVDGRKAEFKPAPGMRAKVMINPIKVHKYNKTYGKPSHERDYTIHGSAKGKPEITRSAQHNANQAAQPPHNGMHPAAGQKIGR